ncbi:MAG: protoporphyrinogen oxidase [Alicyclobacillus sp.]|nr:protoporphyrinogen oxidase [Alicyclobacillus sp.]
MNGGAGSREAHRESNAGRGQELHVAVVGGGITGLSAAFAVQRWAKRNGRSVRCSVFERDSRLGGKILTYREAGFVLEAGPDSLLARKPAGLALIRDLGVSSELVGLEAHGQQTFIVRGGRLRLLPPGTELSIPASSAAVLGTDLISPWGKVRTLLDLVLPASWGTAAGGKGAHETSARGRGTQGTSARRTDDESLGKLLRRRLGDEWVNFVAEPLLAGIYAGRLDDLSVQATFPQFQRMARQHGSLIRAAMISARERAAAVRTAPARLAQTERGPAVAGSSSSGEQGPGPRSAFVTLRGGLATLTERLYDELRDWARLETGAEVVRMEARAEGGYSLSVWSSGGQSEVLADGIVVATPAFAAADLLHRLCPAAERLRGIAYVSTATVIAAFPGRDITAREAGTGFLVPRSEGRTISACTALSAKWPHTSPADVTVLRCFVGRTGDTERLQLDDEALVALVLQDLKDLLGIRVPPLFTRVTRWPDAMPQYRPGHLDAVEIVEQALAAAAPAVAIAGAGYRGLGIPDCIDQAEKAAGRVMEALNNLSER